MKYSDLLYKFKLLRHFKKVYDKYPTDKMLADLMIIQSSRVIGDIFTIAKKLKLHRSKLRNIAWYYGVVDFSKFVYEAEKNPEAIGLER